LYLYFLGLSLKNTSKAIIQPFEERSYVAIWYWIQEFDPKTSIQTKRRAG
jgi:hypothetical protein